MHELGLAQSVLDIVRQYVPEARGGRVRRVTVRVGDEAGVVAESLAFCFSAVTAGTPYETAELQIERVPAQSTCEACGHEVAQARWLSVCPACGDPRVRLVAGRELDVAALDIDESSTSRGGGP
jgi:hydrogenase nickel incorporation protein HypA/HybF